MSSQQPLTVDELEEKLSRIGGALVLLPDGRPALRNVPRELVPIIKDYVQKRREEIISRLQEREGKS